MPTTQLNSATRPFRAMHLFDKYPIQFAVHLFVTSGQNRKEEEGKLTYCLQAKNGSISSHFPNKEAVCIDQIDYSQSAPLLGVSYDWISNEEEEHDIFITGNAQSSKDVEDFILQLIYDYHIEYVIDLQAEYTDQFGAKNSYLLDLLILDNPKNYYDPDHAALVHRNMSIEEARKEPSVWKTAHTPSNCAIVWTDEFI